MKKIHVVFLMFLIALPVIAVAADAVPANDRRKTITASGGETVLDFDFIIEDEDEVAVYENDVLLTLTMDYTVQVSAQTVTLTSAATASDVFVIEGDHPGSRVTQFAIGRLSTSLLNGDFNRLYRILQEIRRDTDRTLQLSKSESGVSTTLPEKDEGKALLWGAAGIENSTVDIASFEDDVAAAEASATAAASSASSASSAQTAAESAQSAAEDAQAAAEAAVGGIKVSADDTTPDDLESKLLAGTGLSLSTQNGGGDETRTITPDIASQGEAEAGSASDKLMTPQRTAQAGAAQFRDNLEAEFLTREQVSTSDTWTFPSGVTKVRARVYGAGGGGTGAGGAGSAGGTTTVTDGTTAITANGGAGAPIYYSTASGASHGTASGGDVNITGGGNKGGRGAQQVSGGESSGGMEGGDGGYTEYLYSGTPGVTELTITIGAAGAGGASGGQSGVAGHVVLEYYAE